MVQLLAAASSTGIDLTNPLLQYGAIGILASAAMFWSWTLYKQAQENMKRERDRADRFEAEVKKLNADIHDKYIPVLTRITDIMQDFIWQAGRGPDRRGRS